MKICIAQTEPIKGDGNLVATKKNTTYNINIDFIGTFQNNLSI